MQYFTTIIVAALVAVACGSVETNRLGQRIVGGKTAPLGAFPYQVSLRRNNQHFCGGSIIEDQWILTAAHCLQPEIVKNNITVVVGAHKLSGGGVSHETEKIIPHPKFSMFLVKNDIGLIKLKKPIEFNKAVRAVSLPTADLTKNNYPAVVSGWGRLVFGGNLPDELQYLDTVLLDRKTCVKKTFNPLLSKKKICAFTKRNQGVCHGDSGGPLVADETIVGIVSHGVIICAFGFPDFYTRVYSFTDWIKETIANN